MFIKTRMSPIMKSNTPHIGQPHISVLRLPPQYDTLTSVNIYKRVSLHSKLNEIQVLLAHSIK